MIVLPNVTRFTIANALTSAALQPRGTHVAFYPGSLAGIYPGVDDDHSYGSKGPKTDFNVYGNDTVISWDANSDLASDQYFRNCFYWN